MRRRQFTRLLSAGSMAMALHPILGSAAQKPEVAITMDDFNLFGETDAEKEANSQAILAALRSRSNLKAAAFIRGRNANNDAGKPVLQAWNDAGHSIANHTYEKPRMDRLGLEAINRQIDPAVNFGGANERKREKSPDS